MTNNSTPKFTLYVDGLAIMSSSGLLQSYLPLEVTAKKYYNNHKWYIKNNWNEKTVCSYIDFETNMK